MGSDMGLVGSRRAALFALMAVLAHVTINYVPLEYVVAAQQSAFATGTRLSPEEAVDAAVVLGYSVEAGTPTLPLVACILARLVLRGRRAKHCLQRVRPPFRPCAHRAPKTASRTSAPVFPSPREDAHTGSITPHLSAAPPERTPARSSPRRTPCASSPSRSSRRTIPSPRSARALESASRLASSCRVALHAAGASPGVAAMTDRLGGSLRVREMSGGGYIDTEVVETGGSPTVAPRFHWVLEESAHVNPRERVVHVEECRRRGWESRGGGDESVPSVSSRARLPKGGKSIGVGGGHRAHAAEAGDDHAVSPTWVGRAARVRELWRGQFNVLREMAAIALYAVQGWI